MLNEIGMIAADTSRTRAYIRALERHDLLPGWVLLLDAESDLAMPGQANKATLEVPKRSETDSFCWSEVEFDPTEPLRHLLERLGIPYQASYTRDINDPEVVSLVRDSQTDVLIYSGYGGALLRKEILGTGKQFLHVHGGYLPDYKGSTTSYYSLLADSSIGASSIFLNAKIDSGPIMIRRNFPAPPDRQLIDHYYDAAARATVLVETLKLWQKQQDWLFELPDNAGGDTYYIIHPVLKHLAIMSKTDNE